MCTVSGESKLLKISPQSTGPAALPAVCLVASWVGWESRVRPRDRETQWGPCCGGRKNRHLQWKVGVFSLAEPSPVAPTGHQRDSALAGRLMLLIWRWLFSKSSWSLVLWAHSEAVRTMDSSLRPL